MAIAWSTINNGDTLLSIREGINTFNDSVVADVNTNSLKVTNVSTDLVASYDTISVDIESSDGTNATIGAATSGGDAGVMTGADKLALDTAVTDITTQDGRLDGIDTVNTNQDIAITGLVNGTTVKPKAMFEDMTGNEPVHAAGQIYSANDTLNYDTAYGTTLQIGQEQYIEVTNVTGATIPNGTPVYFAGLSGGKPAIGVADALQFSTAKVLGVTTMEILNGSSGLVTTFGSISDMNTDGLIPGATVYLANGGGLTESAPDIATIVGSVVISDLTTGKLFVRVSNFAVLPTVLAYMKGGNAGTTITGTATDIATYDAGSSGSI